MFFYGCFNRIYPFSRTRVDVVFGVCYVGQRLSILGNLRDIDHTAYVYAAVTDENSDSRFFFLLLRHNHVPPTMRLTCVNANASAALAAAALACATESGIS